MPGKMILTVFMSLLVGGLCADCGKGWKLKANITGLFCSTKVAGKGCDQCCEKDKTKCGGLSPTCASGTYAGVDGNTAATASPNTACCVAVATCAKSTKACAAGSKIKTSAADTTCKGGPSSCDPSICCENDVTKCGGLTVSCVSPKVYVAKKTSSAYANTPTTEANKMKDCCVAKATCASAGVTCWAGYKRNSETTKACVGQTTHYGCDIDGYGITCCQKDVTKCGGLLPFTCATGYTAAYLPATKQQIASWRNTAATDATKDKVCCLAKAKCSAGTCRPGYKMKAGVDATECSTDAASCAVGTTCCEKDTAKCGGLSNKYGSWMTCAAGSYKEGTRWLETAAAKAAWKNKAATEATKKADCCTMKATCSAFKSAVASDAKVLSDAAQLQPGAFLLLVLTIGAVWWQ